jgi:hypothetical protein
MIDATDGYTRVMTASSNEQSGVPAEEGIEPADMADDLDHDPERVPNAPNRDPAVPPDDADTGAGDDPDTPKGFESFDDQSGHGGNWTSLATGGEGPDAPIRNQ